MQLVIILYYTNLYIASYGNYRLSLPNGVSIYYVATFLLLIDALKVL